MNAVLLLAGSAIAKVGAKGGHHMGHFFHGHHFAGVGITWHICHTVMFVVIACIVGFLLWKFGEFLAQEWRTYINRRREQEDAKTKQLNTINEKILELKSPECKADDARKKEYEEALSAYKKEITAKK